MTPAKTTQAVTGKDSIRITRECRIGRTQRRRVSRELSRRTSVIGRGQRR